MATAFTGALAGVLVAVFVAAFLTFADATVFFGAGLARAGEPELFVFDDLTADLAAVTFLVVDGFFALFFVVFFDMAPDGIVRE